MVSNIHGGGYKVGQFKETDEFIQILVHSMMSNIHGGGYKIGQKEADEWTEDFWSHANLARHNLDYG